MKKNCGTKHFQVYLRNSKSNYYNFIKKNKNKKSLNKKNLSCKIKKLMMKKNNLIKNANFFQKYIGKEILCTKV